MYKLECHEGFYNKDPTENRGEAQKLHQERNSKEELKKEMVKTLIYNAIL